MEKDVNVDVKAGEDSPESGAKSSEYLSSGESGVPEHISLPAGIKHEGDIPAIDTRITDAPLSSSAHPQGDSDKSTSGSSSQEKDKGKPSIGTASGAQGKSPENDKDENLATQEKGASKDVKGPKEDSDAGTTPSTEQKTESLQSGELKPVSDKTMDTKPSLLPDEKGSEEASDTDKPPGTVHVPSPPNVTQGSVPIPIHDGARETETSASPLHPSPSEDSQRRSQDRHHTDADTPAPEQTDATVKEIQVSESSPVQSKTQHPPSTTPSHSSPATNLSEAQLSSLPLVGQNNDETNRRGPSPSSVDSPLLPTPTSPHDAKMTSESNAHPESPPDADVTSDSTRSTASHPTFSSFKHDQSMEGRSSGTTSGPSEHDLLYSGLSKKVEEELLGAGGEGALQGMKGGQGGRGMCPCLPLRYVVVWALFVGMVIINAMRTNVGVTVVTILNKESHSVNNNTGELRELPGVDWNTLEIGYLHAIFYVGYLITQLPAGYLTTRLPSHKLFGACIFVSCVLNLTLPVAIELGGLAITMIVRFVQGLSEGLLYPACYGILRHWSTPLERGRLGSLVLTGAYLGPCVGFPLAGVITEYLGWQYIYYVNGGAGVVYVVLWAWLSEEKPAHHNKISQDELFFIEELQGSERIDYEGIRIPWSDILMSLPVMSLCLCNFARNWVFVLMLTNEPFYLDMFNFSIAENGAYSALPHIFKMTASLTSGLLADFLMGRHLMTTTHTRKLLTAGFGAQAIFFIMLTQTKEGTSAMIFLTLAVGFGGFVVSGWQLNHYDLSTRYASVLVAVTSTFGNIGSVGAPILAGVLTENHSFRGWNTLFFITSGIAGLACLSFLVFGSGERQPWSAPSDTTQLVVKEDSKRRPVKGSPVTFSATPDPTLAYSKLHEAGETGHVVSSHVPYYGSQETTSPCKLADQKE